MDIAELSDIQSESGIIGTLIAHPEYIEHTEFLQPRYFYSPENQRLDERWYPDNGCLQSFKQTEVK